MGERLFPVAAPAAPPEKLSADRRRTLRQKSDIARGIHPATRETLAGNGETCGTCVHAYRTTAPPGRGYWKCRLVRRTFGPGTDIRVSWPACRLWGAT